jgi:hypothetical protein
MRKRKKFKMYVEASTLLFNTKNEYRTQGVAQAVECCLSSARP